METLNKPNPYDNGFSVNVKIITQSVTTYLTCTSDHDQRKTFKTLSSICSMFNLKTIYSEHTTKMTQSQTNHFSLHHIFIEEKLLGRWRHKKKPYWHTKRLKSERIQFKRKGFKPHT